MLYRCLFWITVPFLLINRPAAAEQGVLVLHVVDPQRHAVAHIIIGTSGSGSAGPTDRYGHARLQLAPNTRPFTPVKLQVLDPSSDLVFLSPWDYTVLVPSFDNNSQNFSEIVLAQRGARSILESSVAMRATTARITNGNGLIAVGDHPTDADREARLTQVATDYGLNANELDHAIRAWGIRAKSSYDRGLAKLYAQQYTDAIIDLSTSLEAAEQHAQRALSDVGDRAFFKGLACYLAGRPLDAASAYQRAQNIRPNDPILLNNLALVLDLIGQRDKAEDLFRRSLSLAEQQWGEHDARIVPSLNNMGTLQLQKGNAREAERLFNRGLAIRQASLPANDLRIAHSLSNLGALAVARGQCDDAINILNKAGEIYKASSASALQTESQNSNFPKVSHVVIASADGHFVSSQPSYATVLISLAACEKTPSEAEGLLREALRIERTQFGSSHPETANGLVALGKFLRQNGRESDGAGLLNEALEIRRRQLGENSPATMELKAEVAAIHVQ